jgi:hypothetical protein
MQKAAEESAVAEESAAFLCAPGMARIAVTGAI